MPRIFISYRREDAAGFAGRLADALEMHFGAGTVFRDIDDIRPGEDFVRALDAALAATDVFIALIGPAWSGSDGTRLHDADDYVRREIATALARDIRVIPALLQRATMPGTSELPAELARLHRRQALALEDRSWSSDVQRLIAAVEHESTDLALRRGGDSVHGPGAAARQARRRGLLWLALFAGIAGAVYAGWYTSRMPDLSGEWQLDDGSRWRVRQDGGTLEIEEVHHGTREVWRAGTGRIVSDGIEVDLRYQFQPAVSLRGILRLSADARMLDGVLTEAPGGRQLAVDLRR
ncbi:MAG: toll/interleukin-1 receptor domain-containing protein [Burkholderiales bacterium]|nr:toll/interleukin-1 receptor domain-containing protein [Burkholderiales bacterium]